MTITPTTTHPAARRPPRPGGGGGRRGRYEKCNKTKQSTLPPPSILYKKHEPIDAHGLKIQGRGYGMFVPKFLGGGGSRVSGKIAKGGPPILRFIAFLLTSFSKICLGGCCFIHPPPPPLPPPCVHLCMNPTAILEKN